MAIHTIFQLAGDKGLMKVIVFDGLSHPLVIHPIVHGEPLLTASAFYYMEQLESVAHVTFNDSTVLRDEALQYLLDNYLFEYSKRHPTSRLTSRATSEHFWEENISSFYKWSDAQLTERLCIDSLNDSSVLSLTPVDPGDSIDLRSSWDIGGSYISEAFDRYQRDISDAVGKKISMRKIPSDYQDGYMGLLRVIKPAHGLLDFSQAMSLDQLDYRTVGSTSSTVQLKNSSCDDTIRELPVERINCLKEYNPILLSYYFGAQKEDTPLRAFAGYYNVIEYYFEEAPLRLNRKASSELEQLKCVISFLSSESELTTAVGRLPPALKKSLAESLETSSEISISGLDFSLPNKRDELARWIYAIRCAIVHSKKTRKGAAVATFQPYSFEAQGISRALPLLKWLCMLCIDKDQALGF